MEVVYSRFSIKHYSQNPHKTRSWSNSKVKTGTSYLQWSTTAKTVKTANNAKTNKKRSSDQVFHHTNNQIQCQETEERPHHVTIPSNKGLKLKNKNKTKKGNKKKEERTFVMCQIIRQR